jgi:hypothetical protein
MPVANVSQSGDIGNLQNSVEGSIEPNGRF